MTKIETKRNNVRKSVNVFLVKNTSLIRNEYTDEMLKFEQAVVETCINNKLRVSLALCKAVLNEFYPSLHSDEVRLERLCR